MSLTERIKILSDATGIGVEDASRWIEVAGDLGVESDKVQAAFLKMNQGIAAGKPVFEEFAAEIVRTKDGTVDANATFEKLVTKIGAIEDPTLRAKAAQEAFGRGYAEIAEIERETPQRVFDGVQRELRKAWG